MTTWTLIVMNLLYQNETFDHRLMLEPLVSAQGADIDDNQILNAKLFRR
jgi:hypothetical protein